MQEDDLATLRRVAVMAGLPEVEVVAPRDEQVILGTMRFHYLDWGNAGKPPIVFLHGGGLNAHTYDIVCLALRPAYHCISLDQRGHGDSEWSPASDYSLDAHADDVDAFVRHLRLKEKPIVVGQSMGGTNALHYTAQHPGDVSALVIIDIGPEYQVEGSKKIRDFLAQPGELDSIDEYVTRAKAFNPLRDEAILRRSLRHNLRRTPAGKWVWKWDPRPRARVDEEARVRRSARLWEDVPRVSCPVLVVRGGKSDIFSDDNAAKLAASFADGRWTKVERAGHTVQGDAPAGLVVALRTFFAEIGR